MGTPLTFCCDTETGGLDPNKTDLLTFYGAIYTEDYTLLEELDLKLKPDGGRLPLAEAGALKVNKIDIHAHMNDPATITYSQGNALIKALLKKHHTKNGRFSALSFAAYNAPFDMGFIQKYLLSKEEWDSLLHYKNRDPSTWVDFLKQCGWIPKELGRLQDTAEFFGVPKRNAHSAKEDVLTMIDLSKKIIELMDSKKEGGSGGADLISLLEAE